MCRDCSLHTVIGEKTAGKRRTGIKRRNEDAANRKKQKKWNIHRQQAGKAVAFLLVPLMVFAANTQMLAQPEEPVVIGLPEDIVIDMPVPEKSAALTGGENPAASESEESLPEASTESWPAIGTVPEETVYQVPTELPPEIRPEPAEPKDPENPVPKQEEPPAESEPAIETVPKETEQAASSRPPPEIREELTPFGESFTPLNWNAVQEYLNYAKVDSVIDLSGLSTEWLLPPMRTFTIPAGKNLTLKGSGNEFTNMAFVCLGSNAVTIENLNIKSASNHAGNGVSGYATLYFEGGQNILTLKGTNIITSGQSSAAVNYGAAVGVGGSASLIITADEPGASLKATGGTSGAGIGGGEKSSGGSITIRGGTVTAQGGSYAAGIGNGGGGSSIGDITITGGTIIATGGADGVIGVWGGGGAGIGSSASNDGGSVRSITITGGSVAASGNSGISGGGGAGIGSGSGVGVNIGGIAISSGNITAKGGAGAAGIGNGNNRGTVSNITISGGIVTAKSGAGAFLVGTASGIGGGGYSGGGIDRIILNGGTVTAEGSANAIGNGSSNSSIDIVIDGGSVNAASISSRPHNNSGENVYLNTLIVPGKRNESVEEAGISGVDCANTSNAAEGVYGIRDVKTDNDSKLYFYLPHTSGAEENVIVKASAVAGNDTFGKSYIRKADDSNLQTLFSTVIVNVAVPVIGAVPQETVEASDYTGSIIWYDDSTGEQLVSSAFAGETVYGAVVKLTSRNGQGWASTPPYILVNGGTVSGTAVSGSGVDNTLTFYVVFPSTAAADYNLIVSIPTQMVWAAFESNGGKVVSPVYTITNYSQRPVKVSIHSVSVVVDADGVRFVKIIEEDGDLRLDVLGVVGTPFAGVNITGLDTSGAPLDDEGILGRLAGTVTPGPSSGKFTLDGWYQGGFYGTKQSMLNATIKLELD